MNHDKRPRRSKYLEAIYTKFWWKRFDETLMKHVSNHMQDKIAVHKGLVSNIEATHNSTRWDFFLGINLMVWFKYIFIYTNILFIIISFTFWRTQSQLLNYIWQSYNFLLSMLYHIDRDNNKGQSVMLF